MNYSIVFKRPPTEQERIYLKVKYPGNLDLFFESLDKEKFRIGYFIVWNSPEENELQPWGLELLELGIIEQKETREENEQNV